MRNESGFHAAAGKSPATLPMRFRNALICRWLIAQQYFMINKVPNHKSNPFPVCHQEALWLSFEIFFHHPIVLDVYKNF